MAKKKKTSPNAIAVNRKARHDYFIEETYEAGLVLQGWEVKSLREGKVNLSESYIYLKEGEAWITGCHVTPLNTASTHTIANPNRTKKLLLHSRELARLFGAQNRQGFTLIALSLYWKNNRVKLELGIARGKKLYDKRATEKEREWNRSKERIMKNQ